MTNFKRAWTLWPIPLCCPMCIIKVRPHTQTLTSANNSNFQEENQIFQNIFLFKQRQNEKITRKHSLQNTFHELNEGSKRTENDHWFHLQQINGHWQLAMLTFYLHFKQLFQTEPLIKLVSFNNNNNNHHQHFSSWIIKRFMHLYFHIFCAIYYFIFA